MKDIYAILTGLGIEVPEDKKATLDKEWKENYRTVAELEKATAKRDEYKATLETMEDKLKAFDGVNLDEYKNQIATLTKDLETEKAARVADEAKHQLESTVETFMSAKQFVNDLTAESVRGKLMAELDKDTSKGRSIDDIFKTIVSDKDGNQIPNILIDPEQQAAEQNRATFTKPMTKIPPAGTKLPMSEVMKLKNANPDLDISQYMK